MGHKVEALFIGDLQGKNAQHRQFRRCRLGCKGADADALQLSSTLEPLDLRHLDEDGVFQQLGDVFSKNQNIIVLLKEGFVLIDCAGPGRLVYQVTVGDDHKMSVGGMKKLLIAAGYLIENRQGKLVENYKDKMDAEEMLEFHWVVAPSRFWAWAKKSPKKYSTTITPPTSKKKRKTSQEKKVLNRCLQKCVVQFALEVPEEMPVDLGHKKQRT